LCCRSIPRSILTQRPQWLRPPAISSNAAPVTSASSVTTATNVAAAAHAPYSAAYFTTAAGGATGALSAALSAFVSVPGSLLLSPFAAAKTRVPFSAAASSIAEEKPVGGRHCYQSGSFS
jgi:hypothetical protein